MKVIYYYYYLFYQKILDPDPRFAATLGVTSLEGFFLVAIINIFLAHFFCFGVNKYGIIAIFAVTLLANTFYFFTDKRVKVILKEKPVFFSNHKLTILFILVFSLVVISTLFWTGDYVNKILDNCR
jgi:hypothetical protein